MSKLLQSILLLSAALASQSLSAAVPGERLARILENAEWDLGAGLAGFQYQIYPGSRAVNSFVLPVPYLTFKSPLLEIDRGITGFLYSSDKLVVDISADFALPVNSSKSRVRQGMPDLDAVLQLGPSLEFLLGDTSTEPDIRFELPFRIALATDLEKTNNLGWLVEPRLLG